MQLGSDEHKEVFCKTFIDSAREYDPQNLPWPDLSDPQLALVRGIPFWEEAYTREVQAGIIVGAYAETIADPLLRETIALQGIEETRHSQIIEAMMRHYGIPQPPRPTPEIPADREDAFYTLGYEECFDSYFAFGMFRLASEAGVFPEKLLAIFDMLIDEEARHNLYFVNWAAWHQIRQGQQVLQPAREVWYYGKALARVAQGLLSGTTNSPGFTLTGNSVLPVEFTSEGVLTACIAENRRRMAPYDERLLRPQVMPALSGAIYEAVKLLPFARSEKAA